MLAPSPLGETYRVAMVTPELAPLAGTGTPAETPAWLARALRALGNDVTVVMPRYRGVPAGRIVADFAVTVGERRATAIVRRGALPEGRPGRYPPQPVYLIDNHHYFDRPALYGYPDDGERFAFFCRAAHEFLRMRGRPVDVLHLHHWPVGPLAPLQRLQPLRPCSREASWEGGGDRAARLPLAVSPQGNGRAACVFTVYDVAVPQDYRREVLAFLGLPEGWGPPESLAPGGEVNFLKMGLLNADVLTTVSRAYARELPMRAGSEDLAAALRQLSHRLFGVVNGIDPSDFDPETDPRIYRNYSLQALELRKENKAALRLELGLACEPVALAGAILPLTRERGGLLLLRAVEGLMQRRLQLVVVGAGEAAGERALLEAARRFPGRMAAVVGFNPVLIRRVLAGCDLLIVPSLDDPATTVQLMALRYGSIPVVRAVGALADTVVDFDGTNGLGNGFCFRGAEPESLLHAVDRALDAYRQGDLWRRLVRAAMEGDYSWHRTAVEYMGLYAQARAPSEARVPA